MLPLFIGSTFCGLDYEGTITRQLPVFLKIIFLVLAGHFIWMAYLYILAGVYSRENPLEVLRHYAPALSYGCWNHVLRSYSACSSPVCFQGKTAQKRSGKFRNSAFCKYPSLRFRADRSFLLYGCFKDPVRFLFLPWELWLSSACFLEFLRSVLLGVPGGTVMASLGIITGVLKFDSSGTALMLTIFALQDSFGTACNVTGDGALTLMLTGYAKRHHVESRNIDIESVKFKSII